VVQGPWLGCSSSLAPHLIYSRQQNLELFIIGNGSWGQLGLPAGLSGQVIDRPIGQMLEGFFWLFPILGPDSEFFQSQGGIMAIGFWQGVFVFHLSCVSTLRLVGWSLAAGASF